MSQMDPDLKKFITDENFQNSFAIGRLHTECEEIRKAKEEMRKAIESFHEILMEHHAKCSKR